MEIPNYDWHGLNEPYYGDQRGVVGVQLHLQSDDLLLDAESQVT